MRKFSRKFQRLIGLICAISLLAPLFAPVSSYADASPRGNCPIFVGLISWDCNVDLNSINSTPLLSEAIWTIVANISVDLIVIASYLTIGYVIYGGYLYIFAAGDPTKAATGKKALSQAFIGLAITLSSYIILNAIRIALRTGGNLDLSACLTTENGVIGTKCYQLADAGSILLSAIQWIIGIAGAVALIFVVYGAISYITSAGDPQKISKAKNLIMYSLIGLAIVALAEIISAFVSSRIREATNMTAVEPHIITTLIEENSHEIHQIS